MATCPPSVAYNTMHTTVSANQLCKIQVLAVLKEGVEKYERVVEYLSEQCPQILRFMQHSRNVCELYEDRVPKTNDLIYLSAIMPTDEEWRIFGKLMHTNPSSEQGRIHTWWWYRYRAILKDYLYLHEQTMQICMQSTTNRRSKRQHDAIGGE